MIEQTHIETGRSEYANVRTVTDRPTALTRLDLDAPWIPLAESWSPDLREETPASRFSFSFDQARGTQTSLERSLAPASSESVVEASAEEQGDEPPRDRAEREARVRLELLVRKAAEKLTLEEDARLRVATERLRKLLPRVTASDFEKLAATTEAVNAIGARTEALRKKLGL